MKKECLVVSFMVAIFVSSALSLPPPAHAGDTVIYSYDNAGRLIKAKYQSGKTIEYMYDKAGNLLERKVAATTSPACEAASLTLSPAKLTLKKNEEQEITITVEGKDGCPAEGEVVTATIAKSGKDKITVSPPEQIADESGRSVFAITAGDKPVNTTVKFTCGSLSKTLGVKAGK